MFIRSVKIGSGDAILYELSDPVEFKDKQTLHVIVSVVSASGKKATVFPSNEKGEVLSYNSIKETKETLDHEAPLVELGYEVM